MKNPKTGDIVYYLESEMCEIVQGIVAVHDDTVDCCNDYGYGYSLIVRTDEIAGTTVGFINNDYLFASHNAAIKQSQKELKLRLKKLNNTIKNHANSVAMFEAKQKTAIAALKRISTK